MEKYPLPYSVIYYRRNADPTDLLSAFYIAYSLDSVSEWQAPVHHKLLARHFVQDSTCIRIY